MCNSSNIRLLVFPLIFMIGRAFLSSVGSAGLSPEAAAELQAGKVRRHEMVQASFRREDANEAAGLTVMEVAQQIADEARAASETADAVE